MGNKISCCACHSPACDRKIEVNYSEACGNSYQDESLSYLQHISEREPEGTDTIIYLEVNFFLKVFIKSLIF